MLRVDLGRLDRERRFRLEEAVPAGDPRWGELGLRLAGPFVLTLDVALAGRDVLVRGRFATVVAAECRRCLREVRVPVDEPVTVLYRAGTPAAEPGSDEVFPLPERGRELDLWTALREQVILAVPEYPECGAGCAGLCPRCGKDLNEGPCGCGGPEPDERWAALRGLRP